MLWLKPMKKAKLFCHIINKINKPNSFKGGFDINNFFRLLRQMYLIENLHVIYAVPIRQSEQSLFNLYYILSFFSYPSKKISSLQYFTLVEGLVETSRFVIMLFFSWLECSPISFHFLHNLFFTLRHRTKSLKPVL